MDRLRRLFGIVPSRDSAATLEAPPADAVVVPIVDTTTVVRSASAVTPVHVETGRKNMPLKFQWWNCCNCKTPVARVPNNYCNDASADITALRLALYVAACNLIKTAASKEGHVCLHLVIHGSQAASDAQALTDMIAGAKMTAHVAPNTTGVVLRVRW